MVATHLTFAMHAPYLPPYQSWSNGRLFGVADAFQIVHPA